MSARLVYLQMMDCPKTMINTNKVILMPKKEYFEYIYS